MFYKDKKVLVTGGLSFIGSHLCESLVNDGAIVTIIDDLSSGSIENISAIRESIDFVRGDLRDSHVAASVIRNQDIVFHLANIHGGRGYIETHPGDICQNFIIDGNIFRSCKEFSISKVCFASSACVYPTSLQVSDKNLQERYLSEEMADPFKVSCALADGEYGWGKFMAEMCLKAYNKQYGLEGVSCRLFTVYGPRENESHAVMAFIAKALAKQSPYEIWGSGEQDRNFTYVSDVVDGLKLATEKISDCRAINIGTDEITTIFDAAKLACSMLDHYPDSFYFDKTKPEGVHARAASVKNQKTLLSWQPKVSFHQGLKHTIQWYLENRSLTDAEEAIKYKLFNR